MRKFKNIKTGVIENVTNEKLIKQYTKRPDLWKEVKEKGAKGNTPETPENPETK